MAERGGFGGISTSWPVTEPATWHGTVLDQMAGAVGRP